MLSLSAIVSIKATAKGDGNRIVKKDFGDTARTAFLEACRRRLLLSRWSEGCFDSDCSFEDMDIVLCLYNIFVKYID